MSESNVLKSNTVEFQPVEAETLEETIEKNLTETLKKSLTESFEPTSSSPDNISDDYISRGDIRKGFEDVINSPYCSEEFAAEIGAVIELLPASAATPIVQGHWIEESVTTQKKWFFFKWGKRTSRGYRCSQCGTKKRIPLNYCPNCGAKCKEENLKECP